MAKKKTVTSRDVAKHAGVSQSAVSRCFSPDASISEKTRKKILAAARELGYRPNSIARSLTTRASRTIAVVMSQLDNPFYALMIEKAGLLLQENDYHLMLFMVGDGGDSGSVMSEILQSQADGILMLSASLSSSFAEECVNRSIPVVMINRTVNHRGVSQVSSDNYHGGYWAGSFLATSGHERIAFIAGLPGSSTSQYRRQGFLEALASYEKHCWAEEQGDYQFDRTQQAVRRLFSSTPYPDAVFAANDYMAIAVMETLRSEYGLKVPDDVSVIGFDDIPISSWPSYQLTTVRQPLEEMVNEAITLLLDQVQDGKVSAVQKTLPVMPLIRGTASKTHQHRQ